MNNLFILTLSWNGSNRLRVLYPSLVNSLSDMNYYFLVKDNNSDDDSVEYLKSLENDRVKVIEYKNNTQNFSQGSNLLFNEASPDDKDYILLLNNDVIFNDKTSIRNMISIMERDPEVGVVGARLLYTDTNKLQHAGVVFSNKTKAPAHFRLNQDSDNNAEKNRLFQVVTGAVLLTKAGYYREVCKNKASGVCGMDEEYHWGFDDVDLCLAIKYNMEKKIVYYGKSNIFHEDSASLKKSPINRLFLAHNLNHLFYKWRHRYCLDFDMYEKDPKFNLYRG